MPKGVYTRKLHKSINKPSNKEILKKIHTANKLTADPISTVNTVIAVKTLIASQRAKGQSLDQVTADVVEAVKQSIMDDEAKQFAEIKKQISRMQ